LLHNTDVPGFRSSGFRGSGVPEFRGSGVPLLLRTKELRRVAFAIVVIARDCTIQMAPD
jgi:hypothetical protein